MPSLLPAAPAFSLLFCPLSPRPPSPVGKGEIKVIFMQGAAPLASLRLNPRGAGKWGRITRPAGRAPALQARRALAAPGGGGARRLGRGTGEQSRQPRRGGTGGEELRRLRWSSPPGQGEQVPQGEQLPCPLPKKEENPKTGFSSGKNRSQESGKITRTAPAFSADADSGQRHFP